MKHYSYHEARDLIMPIYEAACSAQYTTRQQFLAALTDLPHLAAQGYNAFGKIFYWNDSSARLYGYNEAEAINQDLIDLVLPEEIQPLARDMITTARKSGKMPPPSACDLIHKDGRSISVFSGHLVFRWDKITAPEFYCVDLPLEEEPPEDA